MAAAKGQVGRNKVFDRLALLDTEPPISEDESLVRPLPLMDRPSGFG